jgi:hypothetical protein
MDVGGGAQRPFWHVNELNKTGAHSARARTRGQNPLVPFIILVETSYDTLHPIIRSLTYSEADVLSFFMLDTNPCR